jgi:LmbE family N-acetylglucosaminyl deacetylase
MSQLFLFHYSATSHSLHPLPSCCQAYLDELVARAPPTAFPRERPCVVTFDSYGVSGHANHIAVAVAVAALVADSVFSDSGLASGAAAHAGADADAIVDSAMLTPARTRGRGPSRSRVPAVDPAPGDAVAAFFPPPAGLRAWALKSVPLPAKYAGPLALLCDAVTPSTAAGVWRPVARALACVAGVREPTEAVPAHADAVVLGHWLAPGVAFSAMRVHYSQFVWFRRLFILFSRYSYSAPLVRVRPAPVSVTAPEA